MISPILVSLVATTLAVPLQRKCITVSSDSISILSTLKDNITVYSSDVFSEGGCGMKKNRE
ncbi:unnamed protein product [Haemonchus placei]|uniref:ZP domain-containing protein n=1 Tax=Haemonchus placei TaxID=6290 RepID=A0A0N4XC44_HAEPC|nr:unnamed protein product [Haemonchus placei]